jgi:hypothetical protein
LGVKNFLEEAAMDGDEYRLRINPGDFNYSKYSTGKTRP